MNLPFKLSTVQCCDVFSSCCVPPLFLCTNTGPQISVLVSVDTVNGYNVLCSVNRVLDVSSVFKALLSCLQRARRRHLAKSSERSKETGRKTEKKGINQKGHTAASYLMPTKSGAAWDICGGSGS
jgi:hypothetical protein